MDTYNVYIIKKGSDAALMGKVRVAEGCTPMHVGRGTLGVGRGWRRRKGVAKLRLQAAQRAANNESGGCDCSRTPRVHASTWPPWGGGYQ